MSSLKPRAEITGINPYIQGKSQIPGTSDPIKLSANESSYGPSPRAIEAYSLAAGKLNRYPDGSQSELRNAIAEVHGLDTNKIICGNGSEELIGLVIRAYIKPGDELLLTENHFVMCPIYGKSHGANVVLSREKNYRIDIDTVIDDISSTTRIVIIANPNNPTGTYITREELHRLHGAIPDDVLLVIDDAYAEYVVADDYDSGMDLVEQNQNVIVTRTFSKIYGLAGLRIGWAYCPVDVIEILQRIRTPFNTNCAALAAATAAVKDHEYMLDIRDRNASSLAQIRQALGDMGLIVIPSVANFYLIDFGNMDDKSASDAASHMESRGIIPRPPSTGNDDVLRITVGSDDENNAVIDALRDYLKD